MWHMIPEYPLLYHQQHGQDRCLQVIFPEILKVNNLNQQQGCNNILL